jgi:hypothetical protein
MAVAKTPIPREAPGPAAHRRLQRTHLAVYPGHGPIPPPEWWTPHRPGRWLVPDAAGRPDGHSARTAVPGIKVRGDRRWCAMCPRPEYPSYPRSHGLPGCPLSAISLRHRERGTHLPSALHSQNPFAGPSRLRGSPHRSIPLPEDMAALVKLSLLFDKMVTARRHVPIFCHVSVKLKKSRL